MWLSHEKHMLAMYMLWEEHNNMHGVLYAVSEWNSAAVCVSVLESSLSLDIGSGVLIAVPIPMESGYHGDEIEQAIQQALTEAKYIHIN